MRKCIFMLLLLTIGPLVSAQSMKVAEMSKHPDKPLSYILTLSAPVKGEVVGISMTFYLSTPIQQNQHGLHNYFDLGSVRKISDVQYEVFGAKPIVQTGTYQLTGIQLNTRSGSAGYQYGTDFKQKIVIDIDTPEANIFPTIKAVEESH